MFSDNKPWNENYHSSTFIHRYANRPEVSPRSGIFLNFPPKIFGCEDSCVHANYKNGFKTTFLCLVPQTLITWATGDYRGNYYDDFNGDFNTNYYDYSSSVTEADTLSNYDYYNGQGITGVNVLNEMRPNPTRPSFITGSNVIR